MNQRIGPPALSHTFTEAVRTTVEFWWLQLAAQTFKTDTPDGAGQPVLVLPGFCASDFTTMELRAFLNEKGYHAYGWNGGINTGPDDKTLLRLTRRLEEISEAHNGVKVALIGHSLGGIYARELARAFPDRVSQVITLGSPFGAGLHPEATSHLLRKAFNLANGPSHPFLTNQALARQSLTPPPVPTTSIYSPTDGIVSWQTCLNPKAPRTENVEVNGSHCGLVLNPLAFIVIADRLAQNIEDHPKAWKPFDRLEYRAFHFHPRQAHDGLEPEWPVNGHGEKAIHLFDSRP